MTDETFLAEVGATLAGLAHVDAVALGGSRAQGCSTASSDWDLAIYYRDTFDPQALRELGYPGEVGQIGGWGGGVFNGGAWLQIEGRRVDVHYRDLTDVEYQLARAERGEFDIEPLMFHLAGIPTYLVVAELAINRVLSGSLPRPQYPPALRDSAPGQWADPALELLHYAEAGHAPRGDTAACLGLVSVAALRYAHAIMAARGLWVTNDKGLISRAGLGELGDVYARAASPSALAGAVRTAREMMQAQLERAIAGG